MELERNKAGKLKVSRRAFTLDYKAEVVRHKKAESLSFVETGKKFDVLPKLVQQWEKLYESGQLTAAAGRRTVSPEQAEIGRMRAENSRLKMEVSILKKAAAYPLVRAVAALLARACEIRLHRKRSGRRVSAAGGVSGATGHAGGLPRLVEASRLRDGACPRRACRINQARVCRLQRQVRRTAHLPGTLSPARLHGRLRARTRAHAGAGTQSPRGSQIQGDHRLEARVTHRAESAGAGLHPHSRPRTNQVWLSDITYLWTKEGWVFVACMLDLFSREIVGWAIDSHMRKSLTHDALKMAEFRSGFTQKSGVGGLIFHSDKGSQYAAHETRNHLQKMGYRQSMSGKGNCNDCAPMESFWHSLKVEETHGRGFETREEAKRCVFGYIEGFYNTTRMHSSINWQSPRAFRRAFEAKRRDATGAAVTALENDTIFNRKPRPQGEYLAESMSANQRDCLWSKSAEMSPKQAPRISL